MIAVYSIINIAQSFEEVSFVLPFKHDSKSEVFCRKLLQEAHAKGVANIQTFYDPSGGVGKKVDLTTVGENNSDFTHSLIQQPYYKNDDRKWFGAAGGLDENNVVDLLGQMATCFTGRPFWSDMQTSVRVPSEKAKKNKVEPTELKVVEQEIKDEEKKRKKQEEGDMKELQNKREQLEEYTNDGFSLEELKDVNQAIEDEEEKQKKQKIEDEGVMKELKKKKKELENYTNDAMWVVKDKSQWVRDRGHGNFDVETVKNIAQQVQQAVEDGKFAFYGRAEPMKPMAECSVSRPFPPDTCKGESEE